MAKLLVIHHDKSIREILEAMAKDKHEVNCAKDLLAGLKQLAKSKPDVIVVGHDRRNEEGVRLLRYLRQNVLKTPVVVAVSSRGGLYKPIVMKLGARGFIEFPIEPERFDKVISEAIQASGIAFAPPPPITAEESESNLSQLEKKLNDQMECFAGKNLVYIQSMILGSGTSKPRICLKCPLRAEYGLNREVYYEFIRDICCQEPLRCEAFKRFNAEKDGV